MVQRKKTAFGQLLVDEIKQAGMSQEEFYTAVGIKKPYFYDLLISVLPPADLQEKMLDVLDERTGFDEKRRRRFYDIAAMGRGEIPADIAKMITDHLDELDDIRNTLSAMFTARI